MTKVKETELAWLAGWWDGEGSIGIFIQRQPQRNSHFGLRTSIQASTCDEESVTQIGRIVKGLGVQSFAYTYNEKHPERHRDAFYIRLHRLTDILIVAPRLLPYAVTKKRQWELILEFAQSRMEGRAVDAKGNVKRGGNTYWPYIRREVEIARELRVLNHLGPLAAESETWFQELITLFAGVKNERDIKGIQKRKPGPKSSRRSTAPTRQ